VCLFGVPHPQLLLLLAVWFALWLLRPGRPLSPHFAHRRLRLRGQLRVLLRQRRAYLAAVAVTSLDTLANGYLVSVVFDTQVSGCVVASSEVGVLMLPLVFLKL
jgi:hypothetical protein